MRVRFLYVTTGPDAPSRFVLPDDEAQLIGRSSEALPSTDQSVSRCHAELTPEGEHWLVRDLDSTNGTLLNGAPIAERVRLVRGDVIRCGDTEFQFDRAPEGAIRFRAVEDRDVQLRVIEEAHQGGEEQRVNEQLAAVLRATDLAADALESTEALERFASLVREAFDAETVAILTHAAKAENARATSSMVFAAQTNAKEQLVMLNRELLAMAERDGRTLLVEETPRSDAAFPPRTLLATPISVDGHTFGALLIALPAQVDLETIDLQLLRALGRLVGLALQRAERFAKRLSSENLLATGAAVAAISHGIKNMLQGLRGGADALCLAIDRNDLELARGAWPILARNIDRIQSLTQNMLSFAHDRTLELEPVVIDTLFKEAHELLAIQSERVGVALELTTERDLPPVSMDASAMLQVLLNLIGNSIDASPRGSSVKVSATRQAEDQRLILEITDHGEGIDPAIRERLFEPFATSKGQRGTGLGLAVSRRTVERHDGSLACVATGPAGTVMRVELPLDAPSAALDDTAGFGVIGEEDSGFTFGEPES